MKDRRIFISNSYQVAVDAVATKIVADFALALLVAVDMGLLVVLDIVAVIVLYFQHLNYYQIPLIQIKWLERFYSTVDFGPTFDTPLLENETMTTDLDSDAVVWMLHEVQAIENI